MQLRKKPLIGAAQIASRVRSLGDEISADYNGKELSLVIVLKGGLVFAADLARVLTVPVELDYVRARSYDGITSSGTVSLTVPPEQSLAGKHVLLVEDILDTGRTTTALLASVRAMKPASVALCVLLDKPARRIVPIHADYIGFSIGDEFVVGYGLDYNEAYRALPAIHIME